MQSICIMVTVRSLYYCAAKIAAIEYGADLSLSLRC